jgi:D-alanine-D-alanine ligase
MKTSVKGFAAAIANLPTSRAARARNPSRVRPQASLLQPSCVAVLYQAIPPPTLDGIRKPPKPGGYSDSSADIAYTLHNHGSSVATPVARPAPSRDLDWVFPDTCEGITAALQSGANILARLQRRSRNTMISGPRTPCCTDKA